MTFNKVIILIFLLRIYRTPDQKINLLSFPLCQIRNTNLDLRIKHLFCTVTYFNLNLQLIFGNLCQLDFQTRKRLILTNIM